MVLSTIAKGCVVRIDSAAAGQVPGVLKVITPDNVLPLSNKGLHPELDAAPVIALLQDDQVHYNGQPVALVVAESMEAGRYAASLVKIRYKEETAKLDFLSSLDSAGPPKAGGDAANFARGDMNSAMMRADVKVEETYSTPIQNHNPMEPHATIAVWNGDKLLLYEPSQWIVYARTCAAKMFGIPETNVRVLGSFVGGGFGSKGAVWSHSGLAMIAAKMVNRPVKVALERRQMFTTTGSRPRTQQKIVLGATHDGTLLAVQDAVIMHRSPLVELVEDSGSVTSRLYQSEASATSHRLVNLDVGVTSVMRGPGEATGTYALEVAMDELAYKLAMDPIALRVKNFAARDSTTGKPFSSNLLRDCYRQGAERFDWSRRKPVPRSMREGDLFIGMGMATATYPAYRAASSALVRIQPDGSAFVGSATHEIGTGTDTVLTQIAADTLGVDFRNIEVKTGDTDLPPAIYSGGSLTVATVGPAVMAASERAKEQVIHMATADPESPLYGAPADDIAARKGSLFWKSAPQKRETYAAILTRHGGRAVEIIMEGKPGKEIDAYSTHSFGAVFAEVEVDPDLCSVRVRRFTGVYDVGLLINKKAGLNQLSGGAVWGISMALFEETELDARYGRVINADLSEYHIPTNADVGEMDISVLDVPDMKFNPLGARGVGEMGITGAVAAVANAVFHATGKRVRDLPIRVDKLLAE
jgi:xanthine dehydrogenase YagR molybdenum-binding subunit